MADSTAAAAAPAVPEITTEALLKGKSKLGPWLATGICGNDITSSCLYVSAIATYYAGALSPLVLLLVAGTLYLYKRIYTEVVEALPLNGGAYNCLLNATSKLSASMAACMTILSYMATAVISATVAVRYLEGLIPAIGVTQAMVLLVIIGVLAVFAALTIAGITESAVVALTIFIFHMVTLFTLAVCGVMSLGSSSSTLAYNLDYLPLSDLWAFYEHAPSLPLALQFKAQVPFSDLYHFFEPGPAISTLAANLRSVPTDEHFFLALFLGFSAALLGVSGFESSANYVEEQAPGVFRKTLRNMLIAVTVINPIMALLTLSYFPIYEVTDKSYDLLARMAAVTGGDWLRVIIILDATLVLSGAVLTSFVGVSGLVRRMTLDGCLPSFLLKTNRRGTTHRTIITFFILCASILVLTGGRLLSLGGVYTISFLGVMTLFGVGNILLRLRRKELKRTYRAGLTATLLGIIATSAGIVGYLIIRVQYFLYFILYFAPASGFIMAMLFRVRLLRAFLELVNTALERTFLLRTRVIDAITSLSHQKVAIFVRGARLDRLHRALEYVLQNEVSRFVYVIHLYGGPVGDESESISQSLRVMAEIFPEIKTELVSREGRFNPETVGGLSAELGVEVNNMFIGAPEEKHSFNVQDLGGVRVIF
jgi:amino acid transporter